MAVRVLDANATCFNAQDAIRRIAQLKDVARIAFDRKIFVECADQCTLRFEYDVTAQKRAHEIACGAIEINREALVAKIREWRARA